MSTFLQLDSTRLKLENFNNDFLLIRTEDRSDVSMIGRAIFERAFDFVEEVIVTEIEVCLKLNDHFAPYKIVELKQLDYNRLGKSKLYRLPIYFGDAEDWKTVEEYSNIPKAQFLIDLQQCEVKVSMFGFLPGFMYLSGLSSNLHVPRKAVPSKYVKANSVAIGGKYLGIYAIDSPGGWNVIGRTPLQLLDFSDIPPIDINPGDTIQFDPITKEEFEKLLDKPKTILEYNA